MKEGKLCFIICRRGGHLLGIRKKKQPEKLKSGIYYVDDPHERFRDESERRAQDRISGKNQTSKFEIKSFN